ncbi:hypothetical protein B5K05_28215 [Rhizobium phaseoli]|nr:hypothetical protein B5K05_28215 [Rhizobium phaseoli]
MRGYELFDRRLVVGRFRSACEILLKIADNPKPTCWSIAMTALGPLLPFSVTVAFFETVQPIAIEV